MNTAFSSVSSGVVVNDFFSESVDSYYKESHSAGVFSLGGIVPTHAERPQSAKTIICFHGSPGCKEDFKDLENHLLPYSLNAYPRRNYPHYSNSLLDTMAQRKNQLLVGYSWGCRELLEYYAKNHSNIETIILISPYILNSYKSVLSIKSRIIVGLLRKILIRTDHLLSNSLLNNHNCQQNSKQSILKRSLLYICSVYEKTEHQVISYASILRLISELDTPIHIITGSRDTSTFCHQSKELIKAINNNVVCHLVNGGNHDILKTHVYQIARIIKLISHSPIAIDQKRFRSKYRESTPHHV